MEKAGEHKIIYEVATIEFDQYKLAILSKDEVPAAEGQFNVLSCEQLLRFNFEIDDLPAAL